MIECSVLESGSEIQVQKLQVQLRRQEVPQQWVPIVPTPMEEVERTNAVMTCPNQRAGFASCHPYAMNMDQENRNYYNCGGFGHLARNYRNRRTGGKIRKGRKLEYEQKLRIEKG